MKKIVPFKKDLIFKTDVLEIVSISLEHTLAIKDESLIGGNFLINGDYRVTESSTSLEKFSYELPFEIHIDDKYDLKNVIIDIDDFYYEIINNKVLSVSIEILIDKLEEKEILESREEVVENVNIKDDNTCKEEIEIKESKERCVELEDTPISVTETSKEIYKSYKVYIVRENDTIESIIDKYGVSKSDLEDYNDLTNLNINDKIIIPCINETNS
jgi:LysM repeat protein